MKKKLLLFIIFLCTFFVQQNLRAQATVLAPGDIAFIGYQAGTPTDGFSFITLKDINAGTLVYFTEDGWGNGSWIPSNPETHLLWTVPAFTPAGKVISVVETSADTFTVTGSSGVTLALNTGFNLTNAGDQILAYQSATGPEPASPTFIAGIHADFNSSIYDPITTWTTVAGAAAGGASESSLPPGLTNGTTCISLFPAPGPEQNNSKYIGTLTGTVADLLSKINNPSATYWSHSAGATDLGITPTSYPTPAVSTVVVATVSTTTATSVKAVSAVMGGNLTADGGEATVQRGIVWATTAAPTITDHKVQNGTGTGTFSATITGLPSGTTIHYRAYATNSAGTSYGTELTFNTGAGLDTSSTSKVNVACNAAATGSATVTVTGGTLNYTYSWSPSGGTGATASNLTAGNYTVTITDGEGTQITRPFSITEPSVLDGAPSTTAVTCFGLNNGTATITPSGGAGSYTYSWSPSGGTGATASSLSSGTYSVTITDGNSCTKTIPGIVVGGPTAALTATSSTTAVSCFGSTNGTATVTPAGGTGTKTYLWSNGATTATATGLAAGTYSVTVKDANLCSTTVTGIVVGGPTAAVSGTYVTTSVSCFGGNNGSATVTPAGGVGGYTYSWSPSGGSAAMATSLTAGTYSVTITDNNGCPTTVTGIVVGGPSAGLAGIASTTAVSCFGASNGSATITVSGGTPNYTYLWSNGATGATASGLTTGVYSVVVTDANACSRTFNNISVGSVTAINPVPTQVNVSCNGDSTGSATVTPTGGSGTYTYLWTNGATSATASNLAQGNYSVTITDSFSCSVTQAFTITEPPVLIASQDTFTNPSCNTGTNGSATVAVSGGTFPYTYSWSPSGGTAATASGLSDGTYTVTVTDSKGCTTTQSFTLVQPSALAVTPSHVDILCNGAATGSASVAVSGGTPGYTYSWSPTGGTADTATGLTAGTYTVTITDSKACSTTETITITEPAALTATPGTTVNINCYGDTTGSATVNVTGGTGSYSYSWAPSGGTGATASGLAAGTYIVTVTDDNICSTTQTFTINGPAAALSATTASTGVSCFGGSNGTASVTVSGGTPGYSYSWAPLGGSASFISGRPAGDYTCTITDSKGCTLTETITISSPTAISGTISKVDVSCNGGTNGSATVTPSGGVGSYTYSWSPTGGNAATASGLAQGTYTVTIQDGNTCGATVSVTIDEPSLLTASIAKTDVLCNGGATGTATITPLGGNGSYTYIWSPTGGTAATATGLTPGTYSCLVTDAKGCFVSESVIISEPAVLSATTSQIDATCSTAGQASVTVSGGVSPYSYLWSNGQTSAIATGLAAGSYSCDITDANLCTITKNVTINTTNTLIATTSQTDILCNGTSTGSASVVPTGAPGPFTYVWSPSGGNSDIASNLSAGNYSVTITSVNGCSIVKNFTITEPTALTVTPSQVDLLCNSGNNGSASVVVTGGAGSYTYAWSPSGGNAATASNLTAGTYTVTITDGNLCQTTQSFTITEPNALVATIVPTDVSCNGGTNGSATVTATGGTGTYSYSWSPTGGNSATASGLTAGTYTVTVTDANSCSTTQSVSIAEPTVLVASIGVQTDITCNGLNNGSATVAVTGGTGTYTYVWSPSGGTAATATGLSPGTYTVTVTDANSCFTTQAFTITEPTVLAASAAGQTDIACHGGFTGSATVAATGGTGTYTYSWSPSGGTAATATGLSAGTYTVIVTDANNCFTTQSFTLTEPNALVATIVPTDVTCNGGSNGSATATVTGGTGTYTYSWAPTGGTAATASGLAAGTYTVTVTDANSCTTTQSVSIAEPSALVASIGGQTDVTCNGLNNGSATVNATGGTGTYTYSWSPTGGTAATATGLSPGTYTVTVTDANACFTTQSFTIIEPTVLTASAVGQTDVSCHGGTTGSATVTATGGTGTYTYSWSPSGGTAATATGLAAGTYTATVTDANNCTSTQSFTITEPNILAVSIVPTDVTCNGGTTGSATATVTGGTGTYTYSWSPSGGTAATATGLSAGTYVVTVTDANSCTTTQSVSIAEPSALIASVAGQTDVTCNGLNNGSATVNATGGTGTYTYSWSPSGGTAATATGLSPGTYIATVTDANNCTATQSFTITEPTILTASATSKTDVTCNGLNNGSATVTAAGGTGTYTYAWAPSGGTAATATGLSPGTYTVTVTDANNCVATQSFTIAQPAVLTASAVGQTDVTCNGLSNGSATVTATGGTGTYTYSWSPSGGTAATATGLAAGNYTATVTDANNCTSTQSFTITEPNAITVTIAPTNVNCHGGTTGSATATAIGGTGTYTYSWLPTGGTAATATGLIAGTYTVTVTDANSCSTTQSVTITEPNLIVASISVDSNVTCNGEANGSASVAATGGTGTYTYAWAPTGGTAATATGLVAGNYTVTVTDANGCSATQNVAITEPSVLTAVTTQTDVTCLGGTDGSATATATGGTGLYTYIWTPSGGTAATATGLSAGNYTVTITDSNGCAVTKSLNIITIPDVTAPVPNLATLPAINASCSISAAQITVPTATDNCAGIITATTTDPLNYTTVGAHVITWSYDDGHGNVSTQNQTVNITASPLDLVTFIDTEFTYNGSLNTIQVGNLPAGATVSYAITPATGTPNGAINAGDYSITATVTPSASTPNCSPVTLTAQLTIKKAAQLITFAALPVKILGANNTFNLAAIANSGLAIRYSFTSPTALPAANVSATTGLVNLLRAGSISITAHQDGDSNYLPAPDVTQLLVIKNNDVSIAKITIGSQTFLTPGNNIKYVMVCDENNPSVSIVNETNAVISPSANFNISTPKPGIYTQNVTVTSEDGTVSNNYTITVEKPFGFFDIVRQKFNNVLLVNNNPLTNGGYEFVSYEWFKNGQLIGTGQYYTAGNALGTTLDPTADYSVKMTTKDGKVLQTCNSKIKLTKIAEAKLYPNPIKTGKTITVEADFPSEELENMQITLYSVTGQLIKTVKSTSIQTEIQLPEAEASMYIVVVETANIKKTLKVLVNK
ncbi:putative secreted protein (Por secretion system target) [Flavobacterium sp. 90]|uniref:T9SS type A sorting domain-containing protein n=1 Tax=unclassified Flavobacterium TaxID=196869 RepID=UPI000EAF6F45|nr:MULTISPECIES: T9SS type A sorting domain-containing protein [unclassified Flavobacterium]RKR04851.1 putative secreted protein (Por secretion system target) [Flavobacterium sp. 81]TCK56172.1 putative secreted protein (Por secretion system target) [Flavobacterium sp. 90]